MTTIQDCLEAVSREFDVSASLIASHRQGPAIVRARHLTCWLAAKTTIHPHGTIGRYLGFKCRQTVRHGINRTDKRLADDPLFRQQAYELLERLQPDRSMQRVGGERKRSTFHKVPRVAFPVGEQLGFPERAFLRG